MEDDPKRPAGPAPLVVPDGNTSNYMNHNDLQSTINIPTTALCPAGTLESHHNRRSSGSRHAGFVIQR